MFFQTQRGPHVWATVASKHASHNKANMQTKRLTGETFETLSCCSKLGSKFKVPVPSSHSNATCQPNLLETDPLRTTDLMEPIGRTPPTDPYATVHSTPSEASVVSVPQRIIGDYELLSELGRGGMGVVYKARQRSLNRIVAVKTILKSSNNDSESIARFKIEAEAAARLAHPNIVAVFDFQEDDGGYFLSMEFIDGITLAEKLREKSLNCREAAKIACEIANAIEYAHQNGIIHRDIKPSNILFDRSGRTKIADFGLAKLLSSVDSNTVTGQVMGTPAYMSPEQAAGKTSQVSIGSDIYSIGAVLYEGITGKPPFSAPTLIGLISKVCNEEPVCPSTIDSNIDRNIETICMKCLEKLPAKRYQSASELACELNRYLAGEPILARPLGALERWLRLAQKKPAEFALAIAICVVLGLATIVLTAPSLTSQSESQISGSVNSSSRAANMIFFCAATGPVFSLCRWIGPKRIRVIESSILAAMGILVRVFTICLSAAAYFFLIFLITMPFLILHAIAKTVDDDSSLLILGIIVTSELGLVGGMGFALGWKEWSRVYFWLTLLPAGLLATFAGGVLASTSQNSNVSMIGGIAVTCAHIGVVPLSLIFVSLGPFMGITTNHFFLRITHRAIRKCKHRIESYFGFAPWPFNEISDRYDSRQALMTYISLPVIILSILGSTFVLCVAIAAFVPMWIAEQSRRILTPEKPVFTDLLAYGVSIVTLAILLL